MAQNIISILLVVMALSGSLASAGPAIHVDDQTCYMFDATRNISSYVTTDFEHTVITDSGNGNLKCRTQITPPSDGKTIIYNFENTNQTCNTFQDTPETRRWIQVITPSGESTLVCHTHHD